MNWSKNKFFAMLAATACLSFGSLAQAGDDGNEPPPGNETVEYRGDVTFEGGTLNDTFPTTVEGDNVRYMLVVKNGCQPDEPPPDGTGGPTCPHPADEITVVLNGKTFKFQRELRREGVPVALNPVGGDANTVDAFISAGKIGDGFRFVVLAIEPSDTAVGGVDVLAYAFAGEQNDNFLSMHNPGRTPIFYRVLYFNKDGSVAGRTTVLRIPPKATDIQEIGQLAGINNIAWTDGAIHIKWASPRWNSLVTKMIEVNRVFINGERVVRNGRELELESFGPRPLNPVEYDDVSGGQTK